LGKFFSQVAHRRCRLVTEYPELETEAADEYKPSAKPAVSGPNIKLLEWTIKRIVIKTLTKLQKTSLNDCQDISQKSGEIGRI
jgi:hypothetical protein